MPSRRSSISMTDDERDRYLLDGHTIQIASIGPKGYPHLVAMWYVVVDGIIHFTTFGKSQKVQNVKRNPKITAMLESGKGYSELKGLVVEGEAELITETPAVARIMAIVGEKYNGIPADTATDEARMKVASKRVIIRIRPANVYSWDHSKLGGVY